MVNLFFARGIHSRLPEEYLNLVKQFVKIHQDIQENLGKVLDNDSHEDSSR